MKTKNIELDVDYIGDQTKITKEEEKAISDFISKHKTKSKRSSSKSKNIKQLI